jgi:putative FmdB family regulatory protein
MPIYEYRCTACGHELETIQKMSDAPLIECPACGKPALQKLISASGFRLKGSGWYETDFKAGNRKNVVEPDSRKGAKSGAKEGDKGDKGDKGAKGGAKEGGKAEPKRDPQKKTRTPTDAE